MKKTFLLFLAIFFMQNLSAQTATTYILCGKLIDTKSGKITAEKTILVKENKIIDVMDGYIMPRGGNLIDLRDKVVMPGLIDMHVHLEMEYDKNTRIKKYIKRSRCCL